MTRLAFCLAAALVAMPAAGQTVHQGHAAPAVQEPASTRAFRAASDRMHRDMAIAYTGDADRDFVAGMLPHHQGAVAMAEVELRYGHDPELRQLAEDIIAAQQKEIAFMTAWQAKHR